MGKFQNFDILIENAINFSNDSYKELHKYVVINKGNELLNLEEFSENQEKNAIEVCKINLKRKRMQKKRKTKWGKNFITQQA